MQHPYHGFNIYDYWFTHRYRRTAGVGYGQGCIDVDNKNGMSMELAHVKKPKILF